MQVVVVGAIALSLPVLASGAASDLDLNFGSGGIAVTDQGYQASDLLVQPDGKLVAAAYPGPARFTAEGEPDHSFGDNGVAELGLFETQAIVLQPDGRLLAAGRIGSVATLFRLHVDGTLDTSFGVGGEVRPALVDLGGLVLQPDGKIVVAGAVARTNPSRLSFALVRYLPDGSLDGTFGAGGIADSAISGRGSVAALALTPDGKFIASGTVVPSQVQPPDSGIVPKFTLAGFKPDGSLDPSFGINGVVTTIALRAGPDDLWPNQDHGGVATSLVLLPDGRIVAAGGTSGRVADDLTLGVVARYQADGTLDPSFGNEGIRLGGPVWWGLARQPDGKLVLGGSSYPFFGFRIARLTADGRGEDFMRTVDLRSLDESLSGDLMSLVLQPDGKIVAGGRASGFPDDRGFARRFVALVRLQGDAVADRTPPETNITAGPAAASFTNNPAASFSFTGSDDITLASGLTFECSLDGGAFATCTSPQFYQRLGDGPHTFAVRARDKTGNEDRSPASRSWTVDTVPPACTAVANPKNLWPPTQKLIPVKTAITVSDTGSGPAGFVLSATGSSVGDTKNDIVGWIVGTPDTEGLLRAALKAASRTYTLTYEARDRASNSGTCAATVTVTHKR